MIPFLVLLFGISALVVARLIQKSEIYQYKWGYTIFKADYPMVFRAIFITLFLAGVAAIASGLIGLTMGSTWNQAQTPAPSNSSR